MIMETCGTCIFAVKGECHRFPPPYPKIEEWTVGCGELLLKGGQPSERRPVPAVGPTGIRALIDKARGKALIR